MPDADIYERLTEILQDIFENDELIATPELQAGDVEDWDSLGHIRLILAIEKAFKIKFVAAEVAEVKNVGELVTLIRRKM